MLQYVRLRSAELGPLESSRSPIPADEMRIKPQPHQGAAGLADADIRAVVGVDDRDARRALYCSAHATIEQ